MIKDIVLTMKRKNFYQEVLFNECNIQPNVDNYLILGKPTNKQKNIINLNEIILNSNLKTINLIGIELNGTTGEFRL